MPAQLVADPPAQLVADPPAQLAADPPAQLAASYDGTASFPDGGQPPATAGGRARAAVTAALVLMPFAGLATAVWLAWGHGLGLTDLLLAGGFYVVTGLGVTIGRSWQAALAALLWAGLARVALLQHVTWSVNSLCHLIGARPYATRRYDRATNLWPLALVSLGESWHNGHHSDPACARHGTGPRQLDISAVVIRLFERLGWVSAVHWPDPARLAARRRPAPGSSQ